MNILNEIPIMPFYVLVEEEAQICKRWEKIANEKSLALNTYSTAAKFYQDLVRGTFNGTELFFFDQDFGFERGVGLGLAKIIKTVWPNAYTCLVTAYPKGMFRQEIADGVLSDVFGKYPSPFDFPEYTAFEKEYERTVWSSYLEVTP